MMLIGAVSAALLGAACFAIAGVLQHREAALAGEGPAGARLLWDLVQRPRWWTGMAAMGAGAGMHLVALAHGPVSLVQPLGVTSLVFVVPLSAGLDHRRIQPREVVASVLVLAGVALAVVALPPSIGWHRVGSIELSNLMVAAVALVAVTAAAAKHVGGPSKSILFALGAGLAFGTSATLARVLLRMDGHVGSIDAMLLSVIGVVVLAPVGLLLINCAFRSGGLAAALATVTIINPAVATLTGVAILHEQLPTAPIRGALAVLGVAAAVVGIAVLVRSVAPVQPLIQLGAVAHSRAEFLKGRQADRRDHWGG